MDGQLLYTERGVPFKPPVSSESDERVCNAIMQGLHLRGKCLGVCGTCKGNGASLFSGIECNVCGGTGLMKKQTKEQNHG